MNAQGALHPPVLLSDGQQVSLGELGKLRQAGGPACHPGSNFCTVLSTCYQHQAFRRGITEGTSRLGFGAGAGFLVGAK